jgi:hypothetical protein
VSRNIPYEISGHYGYCSTKHSASRNVQVKYSDGGNIPEQNILQILFTSGNVISAIGACVPVRTVVPAPPIRSKKASTVSDVYLERTGKREQKEEQEEQKEKKTTERKEVRTGKREKKKEKKKGRKDERTKGRKDKRRKG